MHNTGGFVFCGVGANLRGVGDAAPLRYKWFYLSVLEA